MSYVGLADDCGSRSQFYRLVGNKRVGFKEFTSKQHADFSYKIQTGLACDDMAPRVYGEVGRIRHGGELTDWGYLTEIAKPMKVCYDDEYCDGECFDSDCANGIWIKEVVWDLDNKWGLSYVDAHKANFGYIRRNKQSILVPIDFGIESFNGINEIIWGEVDWDELTRDNDCECTACREYDHI